MKHRPLLRPVWKAAVLVTLFSALERGFGFLYRVVLSRKLGAEGMGLYYLTLSVFAVFMTVAASGIPVTVSRLTIRYRAEHDKKKASGVVTAGVIAVLCYSVPTALILFLLKNRLGFLFTDERCLTLLSYMLPGLVVTSVYAVLRGAFWGEERFLAYSVIDLVEEIVMVAVGTVLVSFANDLTTGTKYTAVAVTISYFVSFSLAVICFFAKNGKLTSPKGTFSPLLSAALPITGMRAAGSLVSSAVAVLLPLRLIHAGMTSQEAVASFAAANAMALPLLFAPNTVIGSVSLVLMPKISGAFYKKDGKAMENTLSTAITVSITLAALFVPALSAAGEDLCLLLFQSAEAGRYVARFSVVLIPVTLSLVTTGLINSMGEEKRTLLFFLAGSVLLLLSVWILPGFCGANALFFGVLAGDGLTAALNCVFLGKKCKISAKVWKTALKNVAAILPATLFGHLLRRAFSGLPLLFSALFTGAGTLLLQTVLLGLFGGIPFLQKGTKRVLQGRFHAREKE